MVCDRKRESPEYTSVNSRQAAGINAFSTGPQPPARFFVKAAFSQKKPGLRKCGGRAL